MYMYLVVVLLASFLIFILFVLKVSVGAKRFEYPRHSGLINANTGETMMYLEEDDERARKILEGVDWSKVKYSTGRPFTEKDYWFYNRKSRLNS